MLSITSVCPLFMFTLFPEHAAKSYWKDWATWGGEAEPQGLSGLCRTSKEDRANRKKRKSNSKAWKKKQANWQRESPWNSSSTKSTWVTAIHGSSSYPTRLRRRTSPKIPEERICCSLERSGCTHAMFWNGNRLKEDEVWVKKRSTDSMHCRWSWKEKFSQFRWFRKCGCRSSE